MPFSGGGETESMEEEDILVLKLNHTGREKNLSETLKERKETESEIDARKLRKRPREMTGGRKRDAGEGEERER